MGRLQKVASKCGNVHTSTTRPRCHSSGKAPDPAYIAPGCAVSAELHVGACAVEKRYSCGGARCTKIVLHMGLRGDHPNHGQPWTCELLLNTNLVACPPCHMPQVTCPDTKRTLLHQLVGAGHVEGLRLLVKRCKRAEGAAWDALFDMMAMQDKVGRGLGWGRGGDSVSKCIEPWRYG